MWKLLMVTMAAIAIAGSSHVYAQQRDGDRAGGARWRCRRRLGVGHAATPAVSSQASTTRPTSTGRRR